MTNLTENTIVIIDPDFHFVNKYQHAFQNRTFKLIHVEKQFRHIEDTMKRYSPEFIVQKVTDEEVSDPQALIQTVKMIRRTTSSKILLINVQEEKKVLDELIQLEVNGIINDKLCSIEEALEKIRCYDFYLSSNYQKILVEEIQKRSFTRTKPRSLVIDRETASNYFTKSETDVLDEILTTGGSNEEIANRLFLAPKTIKNYVSSMMAKLHANNRTHLIAKSIEKEIIQLK